MTAVLNPAKPTNQGTLDNSSAAARLLAWNSALPEYHHHVPLMWLLGKPLSAQCCPPRTLSAGTDPALGCLQSCLHRTGIYLGASGHTHASILLAPHPFFLWHDRPARKQDHQGSCLALIYTLSSFCISILYVSLFRWCVNSMYTFFSSESCSECLFVHLYCALLFLMFTDFY